MNLFNSLIDQAKQLWVRTSIGGRISGVVTLVLTISAIVAVGVWSSRPEYVVLANSLAPTETADYVSKLDAAGIPNQMNAVGSAVLVPRKNERPKRARRLLFSR